MVFKPTAGEISNLWKFIISNEAQLCLIEHWLYHAEDKELKELLQKSKDVGIWIVDQAKELYTRAGFPEPIGFKLETDAMPNAPRMMSDKLVLVMLQILAEYGVFGYGLTLGKTETPEVLSFFSDCLNKAVELYQLNTEINHKKGYRNQPIYVPTPYFPENANRKSFLAGWWGDQRPINALEIDSLLFSLRGIILAKTFFLIFSQIAKDPDLKKFCNRGKHIAEKRVDRIQLLNSKENLPYQSTYETEVTDSMISPFSDKLIMFETVGLAQIAISRYGNSLCSVVRRDLGAMFALYIAETGTFLDDGLKLMIDKNWFEQPPLAIDREHLGS
ncbi:DUF3231 family protein [Pullulanibacillus sp. KACC 23026]|uniref:DUF3231 family protein n=1 Tax=Pullulanibacillus sp. KACC 23026 TaxID=3028315 RepID=UPI0023AF6A65|nr:DUF3231 family protein [Pullulanibacillus sp. KACC 23026]WEG13212.1 DUF3231 family protein [Pullulanibacillus sp. KACC 23026]